MSDIALKCEGDKKFICCRNRRSGAEGYPLKVGDKGYVCIGCEPSSPPQPFIIVLIDDEKHQLGVIFPYVSIMDKTDSYVKLKVGADMSNVKFRIGGHYEFCDNKSSYDKEMYSDEDIEDKNNIIKNPSKEYKIRYYDYDSLFKKYYLYHEIGSFGNCGLPDISQPFEYFNVFDYQ